MCRIVLAGLMAFAMNTAIADPPDGRPRMGSTPAGATATLCVCWWRSGKSPSVRNGPKADVVLQGMHAYADPGDLVALIKEIIPLS